MRPLPVALAALIVVASLAISPNFRADGDAERSPYASDFLHEYVGGWIVRAGDRTRLYDRAYFTALEHDPDLVGFRLKADQFIPMVYPPVYYLLVSPFSGLPYRRAAWAWTLVSLGSFGVAVLLLGRALAPGSALDRAVAAPDPRWPRVRRLAGLVALPAAVTFLPFAENLVSSQKGTFVLLALTSAFLSLRNDRPILAGLVLGAIALKPPLAIVVPLALIAKGERRVALGVSLAVAALLAASIAMGRELAVAYARFAMTVGDYIRFGPGYRERLHGLYAFWTILAGEPTALVRAATVASAIGVAALVARLLRGPLDVGSPRFVVQFSGLVLATVLLSPHVITYDLTILLLPMCLLGWLVLRGALPPRERQLVLWLVVSLYAATAFSALAARWTGVQLTSPVLVALLAVLARLPEPWGRAGADASSTRDSVPPTDADGVGHDE